MSEISTIATGYLGRLNGGIMRPLLLSVLLILCSTSAVAAGWTPPLTVERAFTEDSDLIVIYTTDGGTYTSGCNQNAFVFRATSETRRARAWATILTALATGQKLSLWYTDVCAVWSFHDVMAVMLHKAD